MRRFDLTATRVLSYRAKWWAYKRFCRAVGTPNLEESVRKQIHIEYDNLLQEEMLNGDICTLFTGLGNIYIEGKYVQLKDKNGNVKVRRDHISYHYRPIYDEEGNKLKQYDVAEFWRYKVKWSAPGYLYAKYKAYKSTKELTSKITKLIVAESSVLYKFKENYKRIKRWSTN